MKYEKVITLRDGVPCCIRSAAGSDAQAVLDNFLLTHAQTDYLLTYPDEKQFTVEEERAFLKEKYESDRAVELIALVRGTVVATAGIDAVGDREKIRHRAEFGVSVDTAYQGLGIGSALTGACIECAKAAGYLQLELDAVAGNERAVSLYRKFGFAEYGRNPKGFLARTGKFQELILMRLVLGGGKRT